MKSGSKKKYYRNMRPMQASNHECHTACLYALAVLTYLSLPNFELFL